MATTGQLGRFWRTYWRRILILVMVVLAAGAVSYLLYQRIYEVQTSWVETGTWCTSDPYCESLNDGLREIARREARWGSVVWATLLFCLTVELAIARKIRRRELKRWVRIAIYAIVSATIITVSGAITYLYIVPGVYFVP